jgi:hypothetical protein
MLFLATFRYIVRRSLRTDELAKIGNIKMSKIQQSIKEREIRNQIAQKVKQRLVLLISFFSATLLVMLLRVGEALWPLWMVEHRLRIVAIVLLAIIVMILLSPIIIEFSRNPRALSGPGKNPYIDP